MQYTRMVFVSSDSAADEQSFGAISGRNRAFPGNGEIMRDADGRFRDKAPKPNIEPFPNTRRQKERRNDDFFTDDHRSSSRNPELKIETTTT